MEWSNQYIRIFNLNSFNSDHHHLVIEKPTVIVIILLIDWKKKKQTNPMWSPWFQLFFAYWYRSLFSRTEWLPLFIHKQGNHPARGKIYMQCRSIVYHVDIREPCILFQRVDIWSNALTTTHFNYDLRIRFILRAVSLFFVLWYALNVSWTDKQRVRRCSSLSHAALKRALRNEKSQWRRPNKLLFWNGHGYCGWSSILFRKDITAFIMIKPTKRDADQILNAIKAWNNHRTK